MLNSPVSASFRKPWVAAKRNSAGPVTHSIFQAAVRVARRVSNETSLYQRRVSIPSVASTKAVPRNSGARKMRNFADLQQRLSKGEKIAHAEMSAKHYPLEKDYRAVREWLVSQGFQITRQDGSRLAIFAPA